MVIVGGGPSGPAGLAASIWVKQLCLKNDVNLSICVVEKGRYVNPICRRGVCVFVFVFVFVFV